MGKTISTGIRKGLTKGLGKRTRSNIEKGQDTLRSALKLLEKLNDAVKRKLRIEHMRHLAWNELAFSGNSILKIAASWREDSGSKDIMPKGTTSLPTFEEWELAFNGIRKLLLKLAKKIRIALAKLSVVNTKRGRVNDKLDASLNDMSGFGALANHIRSVMLKYGSLTAVEAFCNHLSMFEPGLFGTITPAETAFLSTAQNDTRWIPIKLTTEFPQALQLQYEIHNKITPGTIDNITEATAALRELNASTAGPKILNADVQVTHVRMLRAAPAYTPPVNCPVADLPDPRTSRSGNCTNEGCLKRWALWWLLAYSAEPLCLFSPVLRDFSFSSRSAVAHVWIFEVLEDGYFK